MAIYIINVKTGRYFQRPDRWAEDREETTGFESGSQAIS
jgi:hypothetical protein